MLETKRLKLRPFKDTDIRELIDYRNNEICAKYQRYDDKSEKALIESLLKEIKTLIIYQKQNSTTLLL